MTRIGKWLINFTLNNLGFVGLTRFIHRSGQHGKVKLWIHYYLFPFRSVINLAWSPDTDYEDNDEMRFCHKRGIKYITYSWGAGRPPTWKELEEASRLIDIVSAPVWVHCEGGKDRTGGLIGRWKQLHGFPMYNIKKDFKEYGEPSSDWIKYLNENA